jgi:eukaryotic-like serine/threonine-protein kinase
VKVLDFGLVKALDTRIQQAAPGLTGENAVQGTPAFIAPEQAMGDADIDGRADIYATGCVAYWLLTGQYVFTADTPIGILLHHASRPPVPPSARTDRPIPPGLERVIMACLAKNPADRPQTARELSLRLAEVPCAEPWTEDRAREWWTAHQST